MVKKSGHTLLQTVTCTLSIALWLVFRHAIVHTLSRYEPPWQGGEGDELDKAVDIYHQKRREAPAFMPGMDRRWARRAQCPRAQQDLRSTRALNGRGHCIGGSPGIHAG